MDSREVEGLESRSGDLRARGQNAVQEDSAYFFLAKSNWVDSGEPLSHSKGGQRPGPLPMRLISSLVSMFAFEGHFHSMPSSYLIH